AGRIGGVRTILPLLPMLAIGLGLGLLTAHLERRHVGAAGAEWNLSILDRLLIAGRALCFYPRKLLMPSGLSFIYPRWRIDARSGWQYLFPLAAAAVVAALWLSRRRIGRGPIVAVLFFAVTL